MPLRHLTRPARACAATAALTLVLGACGGPMATTSAPPESAAAPPSTDDSAEIGSTGRGKGLIGLETHAEADAGDYDPAEAVSVSLADGASSADAGGLELLHEAAGETVLINTPGTYELSGTLASGQVVVDVPEGEVTIVLNDADITSTVGPALLISSAEEATVVLATGSMNHLADAATYAQTEDTVDEHGETVDAPNAAFYSTADLTIAGTGALSVNGSANDGSTSKDGLVIQSGEITVTAHDDGIRGKDFLSIEGGTVAVDAEDDGLTSDGTGDDAGIIVISGADTGVSVSAGDDAVKGVDVVDVVEGTLTVSTSLEGIESARIIIEGGTVDVRSTDDAINAASDSDTLSASIEISGGSTTLDAEGDGLDSNGTITMTGGQVLVHGPTRGGNGSLDASGEFVVSGGTLVAVGTAEMLVGPSSDVSQPTLVTTFTSSAPAGSVLLVKDSEGTVVRQVTTVKQAQSLVLSDATLVSGATYVVTLDGRQIASATAGDYAAGGAPGEGAPGGPSEFPGGAPGQGDAPDAPPGWAPRPLPGQDPGEDTDTERTGNGAATGA